MYSRLSCDVSLDGTRNAEEQTSARVTRAPCLAQAARICYYCGDMLIPVLVFLGAVVVFVLMFKVAMGYIGKRFGLTVRERHEAAQIIVETGLPPRQWRREAARASHTDRSDDTSARRVLGNRVDQLTRYFRTAPVFDSEETRRVLLADLQDARDAWEKMAVETLINQTSSDDRPDEQEESGANASGERLASERRGANPTTEDADR